MMLDNYPKHIKIANVILDSLAKKGYGKGDFLPSVCALADELKTSRTTVHKALDQLEQEKKISPINGKKRKLICEFRKGENGKKSSTILYVTKMEKVPNEFWNPIHAKLFDQLLFKFQEKGDSLVKIMIDINKPDKLPASVFSYDIDGIIDISVDSSVFKQFGKPVLGVDLHYNARKDCDFRFDIDCKTAAMDAVDYLYDKGHRRIGVVPGIASYYYPPTDEVTSGYRIKTRELGMAEKVFTVDVNDIHKDLEKHRKGITRLDAIIISSNNYAQDIYNALNKWKLKIPDDISVLAIGGYLDNNFFTPSLSCFENDIEFLATAVYEVYNEIASARSLIPRTYQVNCLKLVKRNSVKKRKI